MRLPKIPFRPIVLDFETFGIGQRPLRLPPEPVSYSLRLPHWPKPKFYAWGHKTGGNNCSYEDALRILEDVWQYASEETPIVCHNAKFDLDVADEHMGLALPDWRSYHDTMFLLFLQDPHQRLLSLKPSAERILNMPPEERDAVKDWILTHKKMLEAEFPEIKEEHGGIKPTNTGAFIAYAPGHIVEPYCNGDVDRTDKLFRVCYDEVVRERGMGAAYDRERRLMPILLRNERTGVRVDVPALERDQPLLEKAQLAADNWLRKALKAPTLDLDQDEQVGNAFVKAKALKEVSFTATGRVSVSKKNLKPAHFKDPKVASAYVYRQKCATTLETFIRPWQRYAYKGWMHTNWNQVRQSKGGAGDTGGTRTGRPSTDDPNFLNMPKKFEDGKGGFVMPTHIADLIELPRIRAYVLPDAKSHVVGRRDFNQQELRVLAHFEDGALLQAYLANPTLDVHDFLRQEILRIVGQDVGRTVTKNLNFGYIYGQGVGSLAEVLDRTEEEVRQFRDMQMKALPGLKDLSKEIRAMSKRDEPIVTWGGREYFVEPPSFSKKYNKMMSYEYKLLNYLIQGSSADITKESIIRYDEAKKEGRFILSVYDENDISVPAKAMKAEMLILRECMMSIELDVPLLSDGEWGPNLGTLEDLVEPKPDLSRWGIKL